MVIFSKYSTFVCLKFLYLLKYFSFQNESKATLGHDQIRVPFIWKYQITRMVWRDKREVNEIPSFRFSPVIKNKWTKGNHSNRVASKPETHDSEVPHPPVFDCEQPVVVSRDNERIARNRYYPIRISRNIKERLPDIFQLSKNYCPCKLKHILIK